MGDNYAKAWLIPHTPYGGKGGIARLLTIRAADIGLASWWGKGLPRQ